MNSAALTGKFASVATALFLCVACLGTETGNPSETRKVSMAVVLKSSNSSIAQCPTEEGTGFSQGLTIQNAWLATDYVSVHGCIGDSASRFDAIAWNLLRPQAHVIDTAEPSFCGFDFQTRVADPTLGVLPMQFSGNSMWISATRADGVPIEIHSPVILEVSKDNATSPLTSSKLVIALDAADWLATINFNALKPGSDGIIHIAPTSNIGQLHIFERQTSADVMLRGEETDDGVIDD